MDLLVKNDLKKEIVIENSTQIEELKKGNVFVYERIYEMYYNELCSYIYNLSRNKQQAEDIVQNIMLNIWKNRQKLSIEVSIKNYLYRSCYYELMDFYKKNKKEVSYIEETKKSALDFFANQDNDFIKAQIKRVHTEIEKLPPKCKEVFMLNKISGLKYKEVAERLDISVKTVEAQMSKAMTRIREALISD